MNQPILYDLFCKAGGATKGYQQAGFYVVGVDIEPQPNYCGDEFIQADALKVPLDRAQAVHASPPCQRWSPYRRRGGGVGLTAPDLIGPIRERLLTWGGLYVIENIPGAPLRHPLMLCGSAFGLDVRRHRMFELNAELFIPSPGCVHGWQSPRFAQATNRTHQRRTVEIGVWRIPLATQHAAMGIDWMTLQELSQAIPPAYTRFIGEQLRAQLEAAA